VGLGDRRGLTLIEVVVATAIIMGVVLATSDGIVAVKATTARTARRQVAEAGVAAELEHLRGLPFAPSAAARATLADATPARDLLSSIFPHADTARDTDDAWFAPEARDDCPPGTFFTVVALPIGRMTIAATFVADTADGWQAVPATRLAGYDVHLSVELPSAALLVRVTVAWQAGAKQGAVSRSAIISDPPQGPCRLAAPAASEPA
jgi:Tfp pilus assembly protein PilV